MKQDEVVRIEGKAGAFKLLYSHDGGYTRYVVGITREGYFTLLNEVPCFTRGTHEKMAKMHGINLHDFDCITFKEASYYII